jgi:hypothetical protein
MGLKSVNDWYLSMANKETGDMGTKIEDGTGSGNEVQVNSLNEMIVDTETPWQKAVRRGDAHYWLSADADLVAGETMLLVRNDNTSRNLVIQAITIINGNVAACTYAIHLVTSAFTAAGTTVASINMLAGAGVATDVTALADETGNTQGTILHNYLTVAATTTYHLTENDLGFLAGLTLTSGSALGVDQVTESTSGQVAIYGYFIDR